MKCRHWLKIGVKFRVPDKTVTAWQEACKVKKSSDGMLNLAMIYTKMARNLYQALLCIWIKRTYSFRLADANFITHFFTKT